MRGIIIWTANEALRKQTIETEDMSTHSDIMNCKWSSKKTDYRDWGYVYTLWYYYVYVVQRKLYKAGLYTEYTRFRPRLTRALSAALDTELMSRKSILVMLVKGVVSTLSTHTGLLLTPNSFIVGHSLTHTCTRAPYTQGTIQLRA